MRRAVKQRRAAGGCVGREASTFRLAHRPGNAPFSRRDTLFTAGGGERKREEEDGEKKKLRGFKRFTAREASPHQQALRIPSLKGSDLSDCRERREDDLLAFSSQRFFCCFSSPFSADRPNERPRIRLPPPLGDNGL